MQKIRLLTSSLVTLLCVLAVGADISVVYEATISSTSSFFGSWKSGDSVRVTYTLLPGATADDIFDGEGTRISAWGIFPNACNNSSNCTNSTNFGSPAKGFPFSSIQVCHASKCWDFAEFPSSQFLYAYLGVSGPNGVTGQVDLVDGQRGFKIEDHFLQGFSHEASWLTLNLLEVFQREVTSYFESYIGRSSSNPVPFPNQHIIMDGLLWTDKDGVFYDMILEPKKLSIKGSPSGCASLANTDFYGSDIGNAYTDSAEQCCVQCRNTQGCKAWTWVGPAYTGYAPQKKCHLKSAGLSSTFVIGLISGLNPDGQCDAVYSEKIADPSLSRVQACDVETTREVLQQYGCVVEPGCSLYVCSRHIPPHVIALLGDTCPIHAD